MNVSHRINRQAANRAYDVAAVTLLCLGITSLVAIYFVPAYRNAFLLDDYKHLEFNSLYLGKPWKILRVFSPYEIGWWYYRPLQHIFFFLQRRIFGLDSAPYYFSLLLLHVTNTSLVFALSRKLGVSRFGAVVAACLFSLAAINQDVLGWISSVSVILLGLFTLAAVLQLEIYLSSGRRNPRRLAVVVTCVILTFLAREEAILLPLILAVVWLTATKSVSGLKRHEKAFWLTVLFLTALYSVIVITRPNWEGQGDILSSEAPTRLANGGQLIRYVLDLASRFIHTDSLVAPQDRFGGLLLAMTLVLLYVAGLIRGSRAVRIGLLWWGLGLSLLYVVRWYEFGAANRYLYVPWIGLALAFGAALDPVFLNRAGRRIFKVVVALLTVAFIFYQGNYAVDMQKKWQEFVTETDAIRAQVLAAYPNVQPDTHFFAYNLPPVPDYIQSMASVWYETKLDALGGDWTRLLRYGRATEQFYLLNVEDGQLENILPELQAYKETIFIWDPNPLMEVIAHDSTTQPADPGAYALGQIVGPPGERRLGMFMHPPAPDIGWISATYPVTIPEGSALAFGIYKAWADVEGEDGITFRINFFPDNGGEVVLFQESIESPEATWRQHVVDVSGFAGQTGRMQFQVSANGNILNDHGFWNVPRFVSGPLD